MDKTQQDMFDATSVLTNSFGDMLSVYQQLGSTISEVEDIKAVSPVHAKRFVPFKPDEVTKMVNDTLNILELPVMDAKAVKRALKKELKGYKEKRHKSNNNLRAGQTVHNPKLYIDILKNYPAPNVGTTIQKHYKGEESLEIENAFRQFLHRHEWKITNLSHRKAAIQFLTNQPQVESH